ncbi:NAD(P)-dependent dehydrogenase (short-subunit alcohol dehydrogenase family) [Actinoplanes octamycinicus]|uniref:NAD(P)-dependent dehydrogenase (Short-subunit alcohol dehydrogenase family) n=1 Tax=Actinoplanes octamycinicus TaxID=135948 RepID=A0A7W7GWE4_9ACTN|nr:SDR family NAD(P)-dependent oxidoreductase [Actinoplanes octamycinicus]MBB4739510.1 NAD(P)-dependent dehydrogenase (short-subunit alcohol dehydrogenase family) [Actinoplanes octamycinicus]GIE54692.1 short-chain dehydrogenase [Actinoplanes octamycinicus]
MATILITGSSDGIGRHTAATLAAEGHRVTLHARNERRAEDARKAVPEAADVLVGDLASLAQTRELAAQAVAAGPSDVVIHNAGVGGGQQAPELTEDGLERIFQVNTLAPYLLTALMPAPARLIYLTSGLEADGRARLDDPQWRARPWHGMQAYSDSKLYDVLLAFAVARRWPGTLSNAVDPGWIRTRLGGPDATDDLPEGAETQVWLATSDEPAATVTGHYFKRRQSLTANPQAYDVELQERLLAVCADLTGVELPA